MHVVINLNKPKGITSNDALIKVKKTLKIKKAGHAGTLDPLATGVLLIATNEATKVLPYLVGLDKEYIFTAQLGIITDTYDSEGRIVEQRDFRSVDERAIIKILEGFKGEITQKPPIFSALKHKGKPLYEYARSGMTINVKERAVKIYDIELIHFEPPNIRIKVSCSTGTYIRSLCHDIGLALGTGAHVIELIRTRVGNFTIQDSTNHEEIIHTSKGISNIDDALSHIPETIVDESLAKRVKRGEGFSVKGMDSGQGLIRQGIVRICDVEGKTFAIGFLKGDKVIVKRVLHV
ncbi:MAG: tRNA pseudouridine(55) synthase TruB [Thermodesulfovibrionales bacterium]|nr:tRNA pseudouridine(55) synthase TruB [Thermodesulfovibrionales bacterium]